jgi:hypothetical protein
MNRRHRLVEYGTLDSMTHPYFARYTMLAECEPGWSECGIEDAY